MTLPSVLSAKFYIVLSHNIINSHFPSTLDVTISLHFSNLTALPTDTHTCSSQITNYYMAKACKFIAGDHNYFVCLQQLHPLQRNFTYSHCREVFLHPQQSAGSSGGCLQETISAASSPRSGLQSGANTAPQPPSQGIGPELGT